MFLRLHNLIADEIIRAGPEDAEDPDFVFNEARLFNIAAMQHIVYSEQLPALLGQENYDSIEGLGLSKNMIELDPERPAPRIFNEFATASFRYGHSSQTASHTTKDSQLRVQ